MYPDILLRDYARLIIDYFVSEYPSEHLDIDLSKIVPPYKSQPIPASISKNYAKELFGKGLSRIRYSMMFEGMGGREYLDFNKFVDDAKTIAKEHGYKWKKTYTEALQKYFTEVCPDAEIVSDESGKPISDKNLSETEQVPLLYEGGIESFMQNEVLPYTPDAYVNDEKTVIGYELSFTKYFYKPVQLRSLDAITDDILTIEKNTDGMLDEILKLKKEIEKF